MGMINKYNWRSKLENPDNMIKKLILVLHTLDGAEKRIFFEGNQPPHSYRTIYYNNMFDESKRMEDSSIAGNTRLYEYFDKVRNIIDYPNDFRWEGKTYPWLYLYHYREIEETKDISIEVEEIIKKYKRKFDL
jgi:hypothetical protein